MALVGAALCLATTEQSDRKRKKHRTSFGESNATGAPGSHSQPAASMSNDFGYGKASSSSWSWILSGKTATREYQESSTPWSNPAIICQPETRPISHEELVSEVKEICAGLAMVEIMCIFVESKTERAQDLSDDHWKALITRKRFFENHHLLVSEGENSFSGRLYRPLDTLSRPISPWYDALVSRYVLYNERM